MPAADRRSPWIALAVSLIGGYSLALLLVGSRFMTTDAAKYVVIGRNVLAGRGPLNVFDVFFEAHSPAWPVMVMAPEVMFGLDWTLWSRLVQVVAAVALLALTALLLSPAGPRAAPLGVALFAAFPYAFELARDVGLDEVAAVAAVAFVLVALRGATGPATRWAVIAGVTFGIGFLIKEIDLPFAPLPVLAALLAGRGWRVALRLFGVYAAVAFAVTSWWFVMFAAATGSVFRLGTPAWTLVPITVGIVTVAVLGLIVGRDTPADTHAVEQAGRASVVRRERLLALSTAVGWTALLAMFFERTNEEAANSLFLPAQYAFYLGTWGSQVGPIAVVAGVGAIIATAQLIRGRLSLRVSRRVEGLLMALLLGLPLVLLVVAVGEPPRHYVVQLIILVAVGAIGWLALFEGVRDALERRAGWLGRSARWVVPLALVSSVLLAGSSIVRTSIRHEPSVERSEEARAAAVEVIGDWMAGALRPGDTVALGSTLRYELGTQIPARVRVRVVRQYVQVVHRPGFPLAIGLPDGAPADDWVVLSRDPNDVDSFNGYRTGTTSRQLREDSIDVWIDGGLGPAGVELPIEAALSDASGLTLLESWAWPYPGGRELRLAAYAVDAGDLNWTTRSLYLDGPTLERLIQGLEADSAQDAGAARAIIERVVVVDGPRPDLMDRLRRIAASTG